MSLKPRSRSCKVLPPGYPESCNAPFSQNLNSKEFQDSTQEQSLKTMKSPQKSGTQCVVAPENKKVVPPRNQELTTKTLEKDPTEDLINKEIEDKQLTTNVAINLADQLLKCYPPDGDLWSVDIRVPNSSKGTEAENTNSAVEELLIPWTQSFQSPDQLPDSDLKNIQESHASFASTSPEAGFEMLQNLETSFKDDNEISNSQGAGS
ncbi:uncharacterized protein [Magallana gigas]|uniref:uncharacterized protein n=1 Tax=Magallana gigas TaxID=29159 RepID=UPI003342B7D2